MERLTVPDKPIEGGLRRAIIDARAVREDAMEFYWALKKYEDTGLTPEEIMDGKLLTGWIPVSEWLPNADEIKKDEGCFMVQSDTGERFICNFDSLANGYDNPLWCCNVQIVAWMSLPEQYRPE